VCWVTTRWPVGRSRRRTCRRTRPRSFHDIPCRLCCWHGWLSIKSVTEEDWGGFLLREAMTRSLDLSEKLGIHAVVVDALDAEAKAFYARYGFMPLMDDEMRLFLPLSTIRSAAKP
jgi:hypothetical protein